MNIFFLFLFCASLVALSLQIYKCVRKSQESKGILDALQEGVILLDDRGKILQSNIKAAQNCGGDPVGRFLSYYEFFKKHQNLWKDYLSADWGQPLPFCVSLEEGKGLDVTIKPLRRTKKFVLIMQDRSAQSQRDLLGKNFVANASHELRTPITIIKGFAETIRDIPKVSDAMFKNFLQTIMRNCQRMENLVKNLLILEDLDCLSEMRLQECDLVALVESCSHTLLTLHPNVHIETLHDKEVVTIFANPDLLELALMNLFENAVKYSQDPVSITVTTKAFSKQACVTVIDKGVGIAKKDLNYIFDRFYAVNKAYARKLGGAGLGLSIVKTIVEKHRGSIYVTSRLGEGTTFCLTFAKNSQPKFNDNPLLTDVTH